MHPCALKSDLMIVLTKNSNSLGPKTPINMYSMPIFRLEVVLLIFMSIFPTVPRVDLSEIGLWTYRKLIRGPI